MRKYLNFVAFAVILVTTSCGEGNSSSNNEATAENAANGQGAGNQTLQPLPERKNKIENFTTVQWIDSVKQVGTVTEGQKLVLKFRFKNTGNKPLVIYSVTPGCGCTVAEKPEAPIQPGQEGVITGEFDSNGRVGTLHKSIQVMANTEGTGSHLLVFEGEVVAMKK
jgi:hypothetical protein